MRPINEYTDIDDLLDDITRENCKGALALIEGSIRVLSASESLPEHAQEDLRQYKKLRPALKAVIEYFSIP